MINNKSLDLIHHPVGAVKDNLDKHTIGTLDALVWDRISITVDKEVCAPVLALLAVAL